MAQFLQVADDICGRCIYVVANETVTNNRP